MKFEKYLSSFRRIGRAGHAVRFGERNLHIILVLNRDRKGQIGRQWPRWAGNFKMYLKIVCGVGAFVSG